MARSHVLVGSEKHVIVSKSSEMTVCISSTFRSKIINIEHLYFGVPASRDERADGGHGSDSLHYTKE